MAKTLDERLREACSTRIREEGKINIYEEFDAVVREMGMSPKDCGGKITFHGADPIVDSKIALGTGAAIGLMAKSLAATKVWRMRGGRGQSMSVEISKCIARLSALYRMQELINGYNPDTPDVNLGGLMLLMRTADGTFVCPDNNMPKLRDRMQKMINCNNNIDSVAKALLFRGGKKLEEDCVREGLVMGRLRTLEEFMQEDVYKDYLRFLPLVEIEKIGDSDPEPLPEKPKTPLEGVRALGMGHIIAGAGLGRALACHGAEVLNVWKLNEFEYDSTYYSADVGMRSCRIDYKTEKGQQQVKNLLKDADIFFANRRPKLMESVGLTAADCMKIRPGIIYCNTSFAGDAGPWRDRVGYDQVAGCVTGMAMMEGTPEEPRLPVINVVNDFLVSWLAAAGVMEALTRRAREGGSYRVQVSLCRVSLWLMSMGIFDDDFVKQNYGRGIHKELDPDLFYAKTPLGYYQGYTDQVKMSVLKEEYNPVLVPRGANAPVWLVNGEEPDWKPDDPMANIHVTPIREFQDMVYDSYRKIPDFVFKALKVPSDLKEKMRNK